MSKLKHLMLLSSFGILLAACGQDTTGGVSVTENEDVSSSEQTSEAASSKTTSEVGKRSNPVALGDTATQDFIFYTENSDEELEGNRSITLSNVVKGDKTFEYLKDANEYNEEAPEGMEWVMVDVDYVLNHASTEDDPVYVTPEFTIIGSDGSQISQDSVYPTLADGDEFGYADVYSGGSAKGKYAFYAPKDDDFLVEYNDGSNNGIFFNLK